MKTATMISQMMSAIGAICFLFMLGLPAGGVIPLLIYSSP